MFVNRTIPYGKRTLPALALATLSALAACSDAPAQGTGSAEAVAEEGNALTTTAACNSTAADFQLRAFIPKGPLGIYSDLHGNTCPTGNAAQTGAPTDYGFPEPGQLPPVYVPTLFHGDHRSFSTVWSDASRQIAQINVAMQAPGTCSQLGTKLGTPGTSHRCSVFGGYYTAEQKVATLLESVNHQECLTCDVWQGVFQVHSGYPFSPISPHIYDELEVHSRATVDARDSLGRITKQTQHYVVTARHTPFPWHEVVVRYGCGALTTHLVKFASPDTEPGFNNLGSDHQRDSVQVARFSLSINPTSPNGVVAGN